MGLQLIQQAKQKLDRARAAQQKRVHTQKMLDALEEASRGPNHLSSTEALLTIDLPKLKSALAAAVEAGVHNSRCRHAEGVLRDATKAQADRASADSRLQKATAEATEAIEIRAAIADARAAGVAAATLETAERALEALKAAQAHTEETKLQALVLLTAPTNPLEVDLDALKAAAWMDHCFFCRIVIQCASRL